ncbi:MAG: PIN domain-containing protein [Spirochaetaceae bacterium]|nr:PIN domain-containing protein [Spirochaetaceae bacterium]
MRFTKAIPVKGKHHIPNLFYGFTINAIFSASFKKLFFIKSKLVSEQATDFFDRVVSTQVLNELCNIFTKKYPVPVDEIQRLLASIRDNCEHITVTEDFVTRALDYHQKFSLSYFDALMVVAALKASSKYLVTEDIQDGLLIDGTLTIPNIFNHTDMLNPM